MTPIRALYFILWIHLIPILLALLAALGGCINVDKSVHIVAMPGSVVETHVTNRSDTQADGNTASVDPEIAIPLIP